MTNTRAYVDGNRYEDKTLVVVFLRGGADGLNLVVPYSDDSYLRARPNLRLGKEDVVLLDEAFGLNPRLAPLEKLYKDGALAIIHGTGSEDTSRSHFEAQDWMEHGGTAAGGWLGRYLRYRPSPAMHPLAAVAIGRAAPEVLRGAPSSVVIESFDGFSFGEKGASYLNDLSSLYTGESDFLGSTARDTIHAIREIEHLRDTPYLPQGGAVYPIGDFGAGLARIAQLVKSRLGVTAATIDLAGWDSHFAQATLINPLMDQLATGLSAFYQDLGDAMARTTVVVLSEFGRRVYENASFGTDHGRGGVMFVLGGGVAGGKIHGNWKGLEEAQLDGPGDVPVHNNYRDVLAPILARHGELSEFTRVFPDFSVNPMSGLFG